MGKADVRELQPQEVVGDGSQEAPGPLTPAGLGVSTVGVGRDARAMAGGCWGGADRQKMEAWKKSEMTL